MKSICPWDLSLSKNEWEEIVRPVYTTEALLAEANKVPQLLNNSDVLEIKKKQENETSNKEQAKLSLMDVSFDSV